MAKPRYRSRATRAGDQASEWRTILDNLQNLQEQADEIAKEHAEEPELLKAAAEDIVKEFNSNIENLTSAEVESLAEEMRSWADNFPENMQGGDKYSAVDEAASTLESIEIPTERIQTLDDMSSVVDELERQIDDLEAVEFPGMFG